MAGVPRMQELVPSGHKTLAGKNQNDVFCSPAHIFVFSILTSTLAMEWRLLHLVGLSISANPLQKFSHSQSQKSVSMVILNPVMVIILSITK